MKSIGIIGAMEEEVAILKEKMEDVRIIKKASMDFYEGTLAGRKAVVVRSGIGKVNAGICAQILADVFSVEAIINTGIAGSLNKDINMFSLQMLCSTTWMLPDSDIAKARFHRCRYFILQQMRSFAS